MIRSGAGAPPACGWCGQPAAPGLADEDGDPVCVCCARAGDGGRAGGGTAAPVPSPDTRTYVEVALVLGLDPLRATGLAIHQAAEDWLAARGWTSERQFRGRYRTSVTVWRRGPRGCWVTLPLAVRREAEGGASR